MAIMESLESKNMEPNIEKETFNFLTLPYVCQRRFAEICDSQTLKTFSSINLGTRNLCKRCHIIEDFDASTCSYVIGCFCKESEFCKGIDNSFQFVKKAYIRCAVCIRKKNNGKLDRNWLEKLPITIQSAKDLILSINDLDLDDIKMITSSIKSKYMSYGGRMRSTPAENIIEYIKDLSKNVGKFNFTCHVNNACSFSNEFINEMEMLKSQKIITTFSANRGYFTNNTIIHLSKE